MVSCRSVVVALPAVSRVDVDHHWVCCVFIGQNVLVSTEFTVEMQRDWHCSEDVIDLRTLSLVLDHLPGVGGYA